MRRKFWNITLRLGLLILALFTLSVSLQLKFPKPSGPYPVGRTIFRWVDPSRPEILTDKPGDFREIMALVWYPSIVGTGVSSGYFPGLANVSTALAESGEVAAWQVLGLRFIRTESRLDAKLDGNRSPYPVVLLSPGNGTNVEFYASLAGEIASHGYIVVGINHPYDVAAVELSNGDVAPYDKDQWQLEVSAHQAYSAGRVEVRTADVSFAMDQLEKLNASAGSSFAGVLDLNSVAVAGHSLGGITASEACKVDERFKACLNFDGLQRGGPFSMDEAATPPTQPFMFLTKEPQLPPQLIEKFETTSESYWVIVHGASHESFTDSTILQPALLPLQNKDDRFMALIQEYTLAFLDQTLKGHPSNRLSQSFDREDISVKVFPSS